MFLIYYGLHRANCSSTLYIAHSGGKKNQTLFTFQIYSTIWYLPILRWTYTKLKWIMQIFLYEEKQYIRISYLLQSAGLLWILVLPDNFSIFHIGIIGHFTLASRRLWQYGTAFGNSTSTLWLMLICKGWFPLLVNILKSAISVRTKLGLGCEKGLTQNMR